MSQCDGLKMALAGHKIAETHRPTGDVHAKGFIPNQPIPLPKFRLAPSTSLRSFRWHMVLNCKLFGGERRPAPIDGVHDEDTYPSARVVALGGVRVAGFRPLVLQSLFWHRPEHRVGTQSDAGSGSCGPPADAGGRG